MKRNIITVGNSKSDIRGFNSRAIQIAINALNKEGGGTVKMTDGVFKIDSSIDLYDNITLMGNGDETILQKNDGVKTYLVVDADYGEKKVIVEKTNGFIPGIKIQICDDTAAKKDCWLVSVGKVTRVEDNVIYFEPYLIKDYKVNKRACISNASPLIEGIGIKNASICDFTIEGNKQTNYTINGCRGGGIYFFNSIMCNVERVNVFDFKGDGISCQMTEDITIKKCKVIGCTNYGIHPGTGSIKTTVEECEISENGSDGIYVCWRVQNGIFRKNSIHDNKGNGINIGHKDTNNLFESNHIFRNGYSGIYIRPEKGFNKANYNIYRGNIIEDNGNSEEGYGIYVGGHVIGNIIENNIIRDTGEERQKIGIFIFDELENSRVFGNKISANAKIVKRFKKE